MDEGDDVTVWDVDVVLVLLTGALFGGAIVSLRGKLRAAREDGQEQQQEHRWERAQAEHRAATQLLSPVPPAPAPPDEVRVTVDPPPATDDVERTRVLPAVGALPPHGLADVTAVLADFPPAADEPTPVGDDALRAVRARLAADDAQTHALREEPLDLPDVERERDLHAPVIVAAEPELADLAEAYDVEDEGQDDDEPGDPPLVAAPAPAPERRDDDQPGPPTGEALTATLGPGFRYRRPPWASGPMRPYGVNPSERLRSGQLRTWTLRAPIKVWYRQWPGRQLVTNLRAELAEWHGSWPAGRGRQGAQRYAMPGGAA